MDTTKESRIGDRLRLGNLLGKGSFGQTYVAFVIDEHLRNRWNTDRVAVKLPHEEEGEDRHDNQDSIISDITNMARIAGVLSTLENRPDNLVHFLGSERIGDAYVMVCEYVPGEDLQKFIETQSKGRTPTEAISPAQAIDWAIEVADALRILHSVSIFHRDIKPSNVLLTEEEDKNYRVKLADFGLSIALDHGAGLVSNSRMGALAYTPPEYLQNPRIPMSPTYDLYSLGLILYQMCCGELPFRDMQPMGLVNEAVDLSVPYRHPQELAPDIPDYLCDIIVRAVQKRPEDRYQTAEAMIADLTDAKTRLQAMPPALSRRIEDVLTPTKNQKPGSLDPESSREVESRLLEICRQHPNQPGAFIKLADFRRRWLGDADTAIEALEWGLQGAPDSPVLMYCLAESLLVRPRISGEMKKKALDLLRASLEKGLPDPKQKHKAGVWLKAHSAGGE